MNRLTKTLLALTAAAAFAGGSAAPASAQTCAPNLPRCVDEAFAAAHEGVETVRDLYNWLTWSPIEPFSVCGAYELLTGEPCPGGTR